MTDTWEPLPSSSCLTTAALDLGRGTGGCTGGWAGEAGLRSPSPDLALLRGPGEAELAAASSVWGPRLVWELDTNLARLRSWRDRVSSMVLARLGDRYKSSMDTALDRGLSSSYELLCEVM